jgi:hypothetical protein
LEQREGIAQGFGRFAVLAGLAYLADRPQKDPTPLVQVVFAAFLEEGLYSRAILWDRLHGKRHFLPDWARAALRVVVTFCLTVAALRGIRHPGVRGPESNDGVVYMGAIALSAAREIVVQCDNRGLTFAAIITGCNGLLFGLAEASKKPEGFYVQFLSGFIFRTWLDIGTPGAMRHSYQPQFFTTLTAHLLFNISRILKP